MYDERRVEMRLVTIVAVEGQNILIFLVFILNHEASEL